MAKTPAWKKCIDCEKEDFHNSALFAKAGNGRCNRCSKIEWEKNNPVKLRAQRLQGSAFKRAKKLNWPKPDFDTNWIHEKILKGYCEATGIKFDLETEERKSGHTKNPWVPSIDRIDSSKPYLKENIQVVVFMYNMCKSEFTHDDVIKFCKAVKLNEDGKA
jgi:predicted metal-binding protein